MKSTTVHDLRDNYAKVLKWIEAGEEVEVTRRGRVVAKVVPPVSATKREVDWERSAALNRRPWATPLTAEESAAILAESRGD